MSFVLRARKWNTNLGGSVETGREKSTRQWVSTQDSSKTARAHWGPKGDIVQICHRVHLISTLLTQHFLWSHYRRMESAYSSLYFLKYDCLTKFSAFVSSEWISPLAFWQTWLCFCHLCLALLFATPFSVPLFRETTAVSKYFIGEFGWVGERAIFPIGVLSGICGMLQLRLCVDYWIVYQSQLMLLPHKTVHPNIHIYIFYFIGRE